MINRKIKNCCEEAEKILVDLAKIPSTTPPSDTREIIAYVEKFLRGIESVEVKVVSEVSPIYNLIATVKGKKPGKRLLLNGHLDTFEVVDKELWKHEPFGAETEERKVFGTGVSDMKAGCASLISTFKLLAENRNDWNGEVVLALVGGEECGGKHGTGFLLRTQPETKADVCLIADVGSARVIRFGEKGRYRFKLIAEGIPGHGAHAHKTLNANDILIDSIVDFRTRLNTLVPKSSQLVVEKIKASKEVSEPIAGKGEVNTLLNVTYNIGILKGGTAPNLVPGHAEAVIDTRIPVGISTRDIEDILIKVCKNNPRIRFEKQMAFESLCSDPSHPFLEILRKNAECSFGEPCATSVRVGGTDAKHIRQAGIPCYVCGVEGGKMGAPDEFVDLDELDHLVEIHINSCLEYLNSED